jgi:hypothetical protein
MSDAAGMHVFSDEDENEAPLTETEEQRLAKAKEERFYREVKERLDRVLAIKAAIETPEFLDIFIRPIRGNIAEIKEELETVDKPRVLAVRQGALAAYRKMLHFPTTAVDELERKVKEVENDLPLFVLDDELMIQAKKVRFDKEKYQIITE